MFLLIGLLVTGVVQLSWAETAEKQRAPMGFWSAERCIEAVQFLHGEKVALNRANLSKDPGGRIRELLTRRYGYPLSGEGLRTAILKKHGSLEAGLAAAGLDPSKVRVANSWDRESLLNVMKILQAELPTLNAGYVYKDPDGLVAKILARILPKPITGSNLHTQIENYFKDESSPSSGWDNMLRELGLDPASIRMTHSWSPESCLRGLRALADAGFAMNSNAIITDDSGRVGRFLSDLFGFSVTGGNFNNAVCTHLGSWNEGLRRIGLDPEQVSLRMSWNRPTLLKGLLALKGRLPMNAVYVANDPEGRVSEILKQTFGRTIAGTAFLEAVKSEFGSWDSGLRAVGLNPDEIRIRLEWTPERCIQGIQALAAAGLDLNYDSISSDETGEAHRILRALFNHDVRGSAFVAAVARHHGSWPDGLRAAGFDPSTIVQRMTWNVDLIQMGLRALQEANIPLYADRIRYDVDGGVTEILSKLYGRHVSGSALLDAVVYHLGSWANGLKSIGLDPNEIRYFSARRFPMKREQLDELLATLKTHSLDLSEEAVLRDRKGPITIILSAKFGKVVTGKELVSETTHHYRGWANALAAAGIELRDRPVAAPLAWSKELVVQALKALHAAGLPVNTEYLRIDPSYRIARVLSNELGRPVSGEALLRHLLEFFPTPEVAFKEAKINAAVRVSTEKFLSAERCVDGLIYLKRTIRNINDKLITGTFDEASEALSTLFDRKVKWRDFRKQVLAKLGSLDNALRALGFELAFEAGSEREKFETLEKCLEGLRALKNERIDLRAHNIYNDNTGEVARVLSRHFAKRAVGRRLYRSIVTFIPEWNDVLDLIGAPEYKYIIVTWTKELIIQGIQALASANIPLNTDNLQQDPNGHVRAVLMALVGKETSGSAFYSGGHVLFGSWDEALRAAGLDPTQIRKSRPKGQSILMGLDHQRELIDLGNGRKRYGELIGTPAPSPEEETEREEISNVVNGAIAEIASPRLQLVASRILAVLDHEDFESFEQISRLIADEFDESISVQDIQDVFNTLASNARLATALRPAPDCESLLTGQ